MSEWLQMSCSRENGKVELSFRLVLRHVNLFASLTRNGLQRVGPAPSCIAINVPLPWKYIRIPYSCRGKTFPPLQRKIYLREDFHFLISPYALVRAWSLLISISLSHFLATRNPEQLTKWFRDYGGWLAPGPVCSSSISLLLSYC